MENLLIYYTVEQLQNDIRKIVDETVRKILTETQTLQTPPTPKYLTRIEVKDLLHVSLPTLNRFDKAGILKPKKIGGRVLYTSESIKLIMKPENSPKYKR